MLVSEGNILKGHELEIQILDFLVFFYEFQGCLHCLLLIFAMSETVTAPVEDKIVTPFDFTSLKGKHGEIIH